MATMSSSAYQRVRDEIAGRGERQMTLVEAERIQAALMDEIGLKDGIIKAQGRVMDAQARIVTVTDKTVATQADTIAIARESMRETKEWITDLTARLQKLGAPRVV